MIGTFVHRPQQLLFRKALFQIHLWTGILLSLYLVVVGVTGSLLVFQEELTPVARPSAPPPGLAAPSVVPSTAGIIKAAEKSSPGAHATFVSFPDDGRPAYRVFLQAVPGQRSIVAVDPTTGALLPSPGPNWMQTVHDLHIFLLMGPSGLIVNGVAAAILVLLALSGIVIWWPGLARWTRALMVRPGCGWRRINFDLHSAIGFWTLAFVLIWAVSTIYFAWPKQFTAFVDRVSPLQGMRQPVIAPQPVAGRAPIPFERILAAARQATPGGTITGIGLGRRAAGGLIVYVGRGRPDDFSHRDMHYFNPSTGQLLATWHYGENHSLGDWVLWSMSPLHFGTLWGLGFKILWCLLGLSLPVLSITGLLMYWNRKLRFLIRS